MRYQVTCITKPNPTSPHEHITDLGGPTWGPWATAVVVGKLNAKTDTFYVEDRQGDIAEVRVFRDVYVRTVADDKWTDNLLTLDQCRI
jgi:Protein of unknown function (DUF3892)